MTDKLTANEMAKMIDDCQARAEAAERRIAEVEAQLAAQAWRPVTESPTEEGYYLTWNGYDIEMVGYFSYYEDGNIEWRDEFNDPIEDITHWQPLPAPPIDPSAPA